MEEYIIAFVCHGEKTFDQNKIKKTLLPILTDLFDAHESITVYYGCLCALDEFFVGVCCEVWNSKKRKRLLGFQWIPEYVENGDKKIPRERYMLGDADLVIGYAPHKGKTHDTLIHAKNQGKHVIALK